MKSIWKYPLLTEREQTIRVPKNTEILSVMDYEGAPYLWIFGDYYAEDEERRILTIAKNDLISDDIKVVYIGQYKLSNNPVIHHVFEKL